MRRLGTAAAAACLALACALWSAQAGAARLTFSEHSNDSTPVAALQATLDFVVSGSTLLVEVSNETDASPFEIYWIFFNASDDVESLSISGYSDPSWGLFDDGYEILTPVFGSFDYSLRPYGYTATQTYIQPGETRAFTLSIACAVGAICDASDFTSNISDGSTPVLASIRFVQLGIDAAFGGTNAVTAVPEPATAGLLAAGLAGLAIARRRRG